MAPQSLARATAPTGSARLVEWLSSRLRPVRRRDLFIGSAVVGSALVTDGKAFALQRKTAYATICGPHNTAAAGFTIFCATINGGKNTCPPGSFAAGWWRAAGSSWCGGKDRYIVDCNASCTQCSSGCSGDHICDSQCWSCGCTSGSTATCDQRRNCCNAFRYGQCNTHVSCSGGVQCRVVSCTPPFEWDRCNRNDLTLHMTAEHSSPLLPQWGPIMAKYHAMGEQKSWIGSSVGPIRQVGDGRGSYVRFTSGGYIYDSPATDPVAVDAGVWAVWASVRGTAGPLRYPTNDRTAVQGGWLQRFEGGAVTAIDGSGVRRVIHGEAFDLWVRLGMARGRLGLPMTNQTPDGDGWTQQFVGGWLAKASGHKAVDVRAENATAWLRVGGSRGPLGLPTGGATPTERGAMQAFTGGELWALPERPACAVLGAMVQAWQAKGGADGSYGYPTTDTVRGDDGRLTCTFEGGTLTIPPV